MFCMIIICLVRNMMNGIQLSLRSFKIHRILEIPKTAWRHRGSTPGSTCARTQILGFLYEPPGG